MLKVIMTTDTYWPRINGVTVSIDTFRRELIKSGVSLMIFSPEYPSKEGVKYSDHPHIISFKSGDVFRFASIGLFFDREDRLILPAERFRMFAKFDEIKPDIVHIQTEFMAGMIGKSYCRRRKVPMVMTCQYVFRTIHKILPAFFPQKWTLDYSRMRTAKIYNEADIVICPTSSMKRCSRGLRRKQADRGDPHRDPERGFRRSIEKTGNGIHPAFLKNIRSSKAGRFFFSSEE